MPQFWSSLHYDNYKSHAHVAPLKASDVAVAASRLMNHDHPSERQNAIAAQLESEKPNAIPINGWTHRQFIFTYNLFGFPYRRSVTLMNYSEKEQIVFHEPLQF